MRGVAALLAAGFFGLNLLAYNHARSMLQFSRGGYRTDRPEDLGAWRKMKVLVSGVNMPRPESVVSPGDFAPGCEVLFIGEPGGIRLEAWYCDRGGETPLVILFHGYSAGKTALMSEARALMGLGVSVMLVDFRGSGGSSESYTTIGVLEADDVTAVFRYARSQLSHGRIVLLGQSMGAAAILRSIHKDAIQPEGVILEAVFDSMLNTVRNRFRAMRIPSFPCAELLVLWGGWQWGFNGFRHEPVRYAASVRCQVLVMHGVDDARATLAEGRRVSDAIPGDKEFVVFDRCGHGSYVGVHAGQWQAAVEELLERVCGK